LWRESKYLTVFNFFQMADGMDHFRQIVYFKEL
jgi:hypothetical protein